MSKPLSHNADLDALIESVAYLNTVLSVLPDDEASKHYRLCAEKSVLKGDLGKAEDVPGEIADCIISVQWLADIKGLKTAAIGAAKETQKSVSAWCDAHYPGEDEKQRMLNLIEELAELAVCHGVTPNAGLESFEAALNTSPSNASHNAYDGVLTALNVFALSEGIDWADTLDDKMAVNRAKTAQQSAERVAKKAQTMADLGKGGLKP